MRKVNLRNVDPAIDDPDASTWSHPTLNRHSPPEVVANFKRRVPPRLPKPRKREPATDMPAIPPPPPPRPNHLSMTPLAMPLGNSSATSLAQYKSPAPPLSTGRARGFSDSYNPLGGGGHHGGWSHPPSYSQRALPPLTVPNNPPGHHASGYGGGGSYSQHSSHHALAPLTPDNDSPTSPSYTSTSYASSGSYQPYGNGYSSATSESTSWGPNPSGGSLSSLLNPSSQQSPDAGYGQQTARPHPTINTNSHHPSSLPPSGYSSPYSAMGHGQHASRHSPPPPMSPESQSRPNTGYSSSVSYDDYDQYGSRPGSSHHHPAAAHHHHHHHPHTGRGPSGSPPAGSLRVGRARRHSQAVSPYPSPYEHGNVEQRPSTSPQPEHQYHQPHPQQQQQNVSRARSLMDLPSVVDGSGPAPPNGPPPAAQYNSYQPEFAYSMC